MYSWNEEEEFDPSDFEGSESADKQALEEIRLEDERIQNLPVMLKSVQLLNIVEALVDTLPNDDMADFCKKIMLEDAMTIIAKISGAEGGDLYTLRMENAVFIKVAARNLLTQASGLKMLGLSDPRYLKLLFNEIDEFRILFIRWMNTFDKSKDIPDNWGLFNI